MYTQKLLCSNFPYVCYVGIPFYMWDEWISFQANCSSEELEEVGLWIYCHKDTHQTKQRQIRWGNWCRVSGCPVRILLTWQGWWLAPRSLTKIHEAADLKRCCFIHTITWLTGDYKLQGLFKQTLQVTMKLPKTFVHKLNARILSFYKQYLKWKSKDISSVSRYS